MTEEPIGSVRSDQTPRPKCKNAGTSHRKVHDKLLKPEDMLYADELRQAMPMSSLSPMITEIL